MVRNYFPEIFLFSSILILTFLLFALKPALLPFFIASAIAYVFHPVFSLFLNVFGSRRIAALLTVLCIFLLIGVVAFIILPAIVEQLQDFLKFLPVLIKKVDQWLYHFLGRHYFRLGHLNVKSFQKLIQDLYIKLSAGGTFPFTNIAKRFFTGMFSIIGVAINIVVIPIITYYYLANGNRMRELYIRLSPKAFREETEKLFDRVHHSLSNYLLGQVIIAIFVGMYIAIGLTVVGIKYSFLIGTIAGILNMIPYVGFFSGFIPSILLAVFDNGDLYHILAVLIVFFSEAAIENMLYPAVMSRTTGVSPLLILFSIFVGGIYGGILGIVIAVPLVVMVVPIFMSFMEKRESP